LTGVVCIIEEAALDLHVMHVEWMELPVVLDGCPQPCVTLSLVTPSMILDLALPCLDDST
jgi:uncharacterized metal-binding protein